MSERLEVGLYFEGQVLRAPPQVQDVSEVDGVLANRVALVEGVKKVADLGRFPDEGALNFRDGDLAGLYPGEEVLDGVRCDGVALGGHN